MDTMRGSRAQLTRRGLVVAFVVVLVGGAVFGGAVFGFGLGGSGDTAPGTPTVAPETAIPTPAMTSTPTATITVAPTPTATPTPTLTSTAVATLTPTSTTTPEPTPTSTPVSNLYKNFLNTFFGEVAEESDVPIRIRGGAIANDEFWVIVNATNSSVNETRRSSEWSGLVTGYARAYYFYEEGQLTGRRTDAMRVLEINDTENPPKTFILNNSVVHRYQYGDMKAPEFAEAYYSTLRNQTAEEREIAVANDKQGINNTFGPDGNITRTNG